MLSPEWSAVIVAVVASPTLTAITNAILTVLKRKKKKGKTLEEQAMIVLLRRELREQYRTITANTYVTIEELEEFDEIYEVYHALGGNGRGTKMHEYVHKMKVKG